MSTRGTAPRSRIGGMSETPVPSSRLRSGSLGALVQVWLRSSAFPLGPLQIRTLIALTILSVSLLFADGFVSSSWRYVVRVMVLEPERLCALPFDRELYSRMRPDLADLRIVKEGVEIP